MTTAPSTAAPATVVPSTAVPPGAPLAPRGSPATRAAGSGRSTPAFPATDLARRRIRPFLRDHGGVITTAEATRLGLTGNDLRALVRRGLLERVAQAAYLDPASVSTTMERHLSVVRVLLRLHPGELAASHTSAAVLHGLPVLRGDLDRAHLAHRRATTETRRRDAFTTHRCPGADAFTAVDGLDVVVPALAVLGTVLVSGAASGITVADAALRGGLTSKDELDRWIERLGHTPGLAAARHVVARACPSAESPGESLARLVLLDLGYAVVPQFRIVEADGVVIARVDFYLPELGVVVEFDGRVKYDGAEGASALAAEKQREDRIRALGYGVARLTWRDLFFPARVRAAVEQAARASAATRRSA